MIPISVVDVADAEPLVVEVLRSGALTQGPMVERFEAGFARLAGTNNAVAVNSGTTALVAALEVLGLAPGDEVVTSPFTFVATLNAILQAGATVRFADIGAHDFALHPERVAEAITERTRVLMPVHLYGQTGDMGALAALADAHGLHIVEDAAQAAGAAFDGRRAGSYGLGCFSTYATKNITTGEGGVITTDDDGFAATLRMLRNQGMRERYVYDMPGHNYRMTELHAAIGVAQLETFDAATAARRRNARLLSDGLAGTPGVTLPAEQPLREHVWHQYTVRIDPNAALTRDELARELARRGVGSGVYYPRVVFDYPCFAGHPLVPDASIDTVPEAAAAAREVLSLPVHPALTPPQLEQIIESVREVLG